MRNGFAVLVMIGLGALLGLGAGCTDDRSGADREVVAQTGGTGVPAMPTPGVTPR
jgi:hypothetical protein